jgi:hypothetical protein
MSVQQLFSDWAAIGSQLTRVVDYVIVDSTAKLPQSVSGVITLEDNTTYFFTTTIDLLGSRLVCGQNTTILGGSSENCRIKSTGLTGTALITSAWSLPIRSIAFEADIVFNLNANGNANQALDWFGVNVIDSNTVGTIANYTNFIASDCGFLNTQGLTFDGSVGTIGFAQTIFDCKAGGTSIIIPSTATITRRFRIIYSAFVILSGETGINVSSSATIPVEGYILDTVNFSGGGTYTTGVAYTDNKALFSNNRGINNSAEIAYYTMNNNATATTVASSGVAYKVAGTTTSQSVTQKFTNTNNRATYTGAITRAFSVSAVLSCTSGNNNQIGLYIAKNGAILTESEVYITTGGSGRAEGGKIQAILQLVTNDYIEIFVENSTTATNITVTELSVIVEALS